MPQGPLHLSQHVEGVSQVDSPSLESDDKRDCPGSTETSDGKYGHSDGPE